MSKKLTVKEINKLLRMAGNHEYYLREKMAVAEPGYFVQVSRGYLHRVVATLGQLTTLTVVSIESAPKKLETPEAAG